MILRFVFVLALSVLSAGCGGGDEEASAPPTSVAPTTSTTAPPPTTAPPADPFAVPTDPAGIDAAYVESVANELYRILGDAGRILMQGGSPEEVVKRYDAVYAPRVVDDFLAAELEHANDGFPGVRTDPGNARLEVRAIRDVGSDCILADVVQDVSEVVVLATEGFEGVLLLQRSPNGVDPEGLNRTDWVMEGVGEYSEFKGLTCDDL